MNHTASAVTRRHHLAHWLSKRSCPEIFGLLEAMTVAKATETAAAIKEAPTKRTALLPARMAKGSARQSDSPWRDF